MELVTAGATQHADQYTHPRRTSDGENVYAKSSPVDELIFDTHLARRLGLYDQPTPSLPQRSRLRGGSIDAQSISPVRSQPGQAFPTTNVTDGSPSAQSAIGIPADTLPSYIHSPSEVQSRTNQDTVTQSDQPQEEEDEYCDCLHHGPTEQMMSFATYEDAPPHSPVSVTSSVFGPERLHVRRSVSSLEYNNNYHSSTSGSAVSSWVQNISSRTSYDDVAVDSLSSPSDSARESDDISYTSPPVPYVHVGSDSEGTSCIPTASRDEIAQILREKAEHARSISMVEEKHRSKLGSNLKKVAAKLRLQSTPAQPINPMVLAQWYPSMSLKELEFFSLNPGALSQLQSSKTNIKRVTKLDEGSTRAGLKSESENMHHLRPTRTLEDVLPSLTSGEKNFLLANPDAAKILPTAASFSDPAVHQLRPTTASSRFRSNGHKRIVSVTSTKSEPLKDASNIETVAIFTSTTTVDQPVNETPGRLFSLKTSNRTRSGKLASPQLPESQPVPQSHLTAINTTPETNSHGELTSTTKSSGLNRLRRISSKLSLLALTSSKDREIDSECGPVPQNLNTRPALASRSITGPPSLSKPEILLSAPSTSFRTPIPTPETSLQRQELSGNNAYKHDDGAITRPTTAATFCDTNSSGPTNPTRKPSLAHRLATKLSTLPLQARPSIVQRHHPSFAFTSNEYTPAGDVDVMRSTSGHYPADDDAGRIEYETVDGCQLGGPGLRTGMLAT